mmetsp:Transcript_8999/g.17991  ORF Transcript_8999/g.17991 Transcript_8999/m.17991 type:complete len:244 (+) Transcript_8999:597-1328(+)
MQVAQPSHKPPGVKSELRRDGHIDASFEQRVCLVNQDRAGRLEVDTGYLEAIWMACQCNTSYTESLQISHLCLHEGARAGVRARARIQIVAADKQDVPRTGGHQVAKDRAEFGSLPESRHGDVRDWTEAVSNQLLGCRGDAAKVSQVRLHHAHVDRPARPRLRGGAGRERGGELLQQPRAACPARLLRGHLHGQSLPKLRQALAQSARPAGPSRAGGRARAQGGEGCAAEVCSPVQWPPQARR